MEPDKLELDGNNCNVNGRKTKSNMPVDTWKLESCCRGSMSARDKAGGHPGQEHVTKAVSWCWVCLPGAGWVNGFARGGRIP